MTRELNIEGVGFIIKLRSNNILHAHILNIEPNSDASILSFNYSIRELLANNKVPLLMTFDDFTVPSHRIRKFWARKESCPNSLADAYVVTNLGHALIGRFYIKECNPTRPTKIFNKEEDAIQWLRTFVEKSDP